MEGVTRAQAHPGHEEDDVGALERERIPPDTGARRQSAARARPERAIDVASPQNFHFCTAKRVQHVVLRVLITLVQRAWTKSAEDELHLILKLDTAIFCERKSSHRDDLATTSLSPGLGVQRTTILESLGSN